ncbi:hypothetical protein HYFRA_00006101 [Hymenoscyphus fraxineus]|uniref:Uncharacterized protein n=1 Tax=Hymenoscyphus fraxineus TaxID=746836 RepID=A0A9N9Q1A1_9HELO|nr:hypothetical protein HYFRA_00006101 [Hymenoscyphus fraxineus]
MSSNQQSSQTGTTQGEGSEQEGSSSATGSGQAGQGGSSSASGSEPAVVRIETPGVGPGYYKYQCKHYKAEDRKHIKVWVNGAPCAHCLLYYNPKLRVVGFNMIPTSYSQLGEY